MESKPAVFAIRAISIERTRRTVMDETTSPRASFSFTLLRTISLGRADMASLPGRCPLLYACALGGIRGPVGPGRDAPRYRNPKRDGVPQPRPEELNWPPSQVGDDPWHLYTYSEHVHSP